MRDDPAVVPQGLFAVCGSTRAYPAGTARIAGAAESVAQVCHSVNAWIVCRTCLAGVALSGSLELTAIFPLDIRDASLQGRSMASQASSVLRVSVLKFPPHEHRRYCRQCSCHHEITRPMRRMLHSFFRNGGIKIPYLAKNLNL